MHLKHAPLNEDYLRAWSATASNCFVAREEAACDTPTTAGKFATHIYPNYHQAKEGAHGVVWRTIVVVSVSFGERHCPPLVHQMELAIRLFQALAYSAIGFFLSFIEYMTARRKSVADRVIVITGAAEGIGKEMAARFAVLKAKVVLLDVNAELNAKAAEEIRKSGGCAYDFAVDVTKPDKMHQIAATIRDHPDLGCADIVICSAAILIPKLLEDNTDADIRRTFDVNVLGYFWTIKAFYPMMLARGSGHIVAVSSVGGHFGTAYSSTYSASKFAIRGLMESLEWEIHDQGLSDHLKTTTVYPFFTKTNLLKSCTLSSPVLPFLTIEQTAKGIVDAVLYEKSEAYIPNYCKWFCVELKSIASMSKYVQHAFRNFFDIRYR
uniref:Short-chain dehydrogenase/reductase 3 n=1 Tax=Trichuris muris TaxID=70415 RepID=A0A5S6Q0A7_TRIMR